MSPFWRSLAMPAALSLQLVLAGSILAGSVLAASAEHFETEEYAMSGGLECINAPAAYALGWTGKGVTVGVMDGPVRQDPYDLAGTMERFSLMDEMEPVQDWDTEMHGTHVAGLLAARRNAVGMHGVLHAQDTLLAGDVLFQPREGQFYASSTSLVLEDFLTGSDPETAGFALAAARDTSPTLETELLGLAVSANDPGALSATVRVHRPADAYSRHARHAGAASLGRVLTRIAGTARGDMRHLLTALDWSAPDGSQVRDGLEALGPEAWDAAARASLAQQNEFNLLLLRRMLATARMTFAAGSSDRLPASQAAGRDGRRAAADWQFWASPCGSGTWQGSHGSTSSWKSTGTGLLAGADRFFESGITLGAHVALAARRTHVSDRHEAQIDTKSAFIGVQGLYAPDARDGVWLTAQGRLGLESGEMDRTVSFNGYARHNESRWSGLAGSALLGAGRDWRWQREDSLASAGPLAFVEYSFAHRPGVEEQQGGASRLDVDDTVYDSLLLSLGAHAGWTTQLENGSGLGLDLLAAWRHELLDATFCTEAAFRDYED